MGEKQKKNTNEPDNNPNTRTHAQTQIHSGTNDEWFFFMAFLFTAVYRISNWRFMDLLLNGKSEYFVNKTYTKRMRREILPKSRRFLTIISTFVSSWSL